MDHWRNDVVHQISGLFSIAWLPSLLQERQVMALLFNYDEVLSALIRQFSQYWLLVLSNCGYFEKIVGNALFSLSICVDP
jgi:hypothetical protein